MSNKCFVTKLANSVDKDNLLKLGELRMRFKKPTNGLLNGIYTELTASSKVIVSFPYGSENLKFVDTGSNNSPIGTYFDANNLSTTSIGIQVSEPYDREYIDVSFIPFYYLTKITFRFSDNILGFIDSNGNYVGFKPFKYTNIVSLDLGHTNFSGVLDDVPKTVITLGVENTKVTGDISSLKDMVGMEYIGLGETQVTGDISNLKDMVGITYLDLRGTQVTGDISNLKDMVGITDLDLRGTQVTGDISNLKDMVGITYLDLWGTQVTGDITELVNNMTELGSLSIPRTVTITEAQKKTLTDRGCTVAIAA